MPDRFCTKCGGVIEGNDRFCGSCGAPAEVAPPPMGPTAVAKAATAVSPTPTTRSAPPWANLSRQALGGIAAVVVAVVVGGVVMLTNSGKDTTPTTTPVTAQAATSTTAIATTATTASTAATDGDLPLGVPYSAYETITDDSGVLQVSVPVEWADRSGAAWNPSTDNVPVGPGLQAAPNLAAWTEGWSTPGVFFGASTELGITADELLDRLNFDEFCDLTSRDDYDDGLYVGKIAAWVNCGGVGSSFAQIAAEPHEGGALMLVTVVIVTQADLDAFEKIVESFQLTSDLGG